MHGLIRDEAFEFRNDGARLTSWIEITPEHPVFDGFPFRCLFTMRHSLHECGLTVSYQLENRDSRNIPFGYGIHPFWRLHGDRGQVEVRVPCDYVLELADLVPTGAVLPVEGNELDLRRNRSLEGLFIDNAFWKRSPGDQAELRFAALGRKLIFEASDDFLHMIVYAPRAEPFVCVENLTTCPNAPNLVSAGQGEMASMLVAPPGETLEGWIRYRIKAIDDAHQQH